MNNLAFVVIVMCVYVCPLQGSIIVKTCPDFQPVDNFNFKDFSGVWYEAARLPNEFEKTHCNKFDFVIKEDGKMFLQLGASDKLVGSSDYFESSFGLAPGSEDKGLLLHEIKYGEPQTTMTLREYIIALDNDNFFISAECKYDAETNTVYEYAWVMTRSKNYSAEVKAAIDNYLKSSKDIDASKLIWLDMESEHC